MLIIATTTGAKNIPKNPKKFKPPIIAKNSIIGCIDTLLPTTTGLIILSTKLITKVPYKKNITPAKTLLETNT